MGAGTVGYELILFAHVLGAIGLMGAGLIAEPVVHSYLRRAGSVDEIRRWLTIGRPLAMISPLSSITLLATGAILASLGSWWAEPWLLVAVAMWIISAAAATGVKRSMGQVAELATSAENGPVSADIEAARRSSRLTVLPDLLVAGDLGVLFLMVVKPAGWLAPIVAILTAQIVVLGGRRALGAIRPRVSGPVMG